MKTPILTVVAKLKKREKKTWFWALLQCSMKNKIWKVIISFTFIKCDQLWGWPHLLRDICETTSHSPTQPNGHPTKILNAKSIKFTLQKNKLFFVSVGLKKKKKEYLWTRFQI